MVKLAAIDLGSNSFRLLEASYQGEKLKYRRHLKEKVQIGAGLDLKQNLSQGAICRGLDCLKKFQSYIDNQNIQHLIIAGTHTLRIANNSEQFLQAAEKILNKPIQVITGETEAKLIFSAVNQEIQAKDVGLVIDIGGGSTEFALGDIAEISLSRSLDLGCVSYYQRFFADGKINQENVKAAGNAAQIELKSHLDDLISIPKQWIVGTSGTLQSIAILAQELFNDPNNSLSLQSIEALESKLIAAADVRALNFIHLDEDRRAILPAGLAIAKAIFNNLGIERIQICQSALCEGLLLDWCEKSNA